MYEFLIGKIVINILLIHTYKSEVDLLFNQSIILIILSFKFNLLILQ